MAGYLVRQIDPWRRRYQNHSSPWVILGEPLKGLDTFDEVLFDGLIATDFALRSKTRKWATYDYQMSLFRGQVHGRLGLAQIRVMTSVS